MVSHHQVGCVTTLRIDRLDPAASVSQWFLSVPSDTRWVQVDAPVPFAVWHAQFTFLEHRWNWMIQTETPAGSRWKTGEVRIETAQPLTIFDAACIIAGEGGQAMLGPIECFFSAPTPRGPWQWHSVATVAPRTAPAWSMTRWTARRASSGMACRGADEDTAMSMMQTYHHSL